MINKDAVKCQIRKWENERTGPVSSLPILIRSTPIDPLRKSAEGENNGLDRGKNRNHVQQVAVHCLYFHLGRGHCFNLPRTFARGLYRRTGTPPLSQTGQAFNPPREKHLYELLV